MKKIYVFFISLSTFMDWMRWFSLAMQITHLNRILRRNLIRQYVCVWAWDKPLKNPFVTIFFLLRCWMPFLFLQPSIKPLLNIHIAIWILPQKCGTPAAAVLVLCWHHRWHQFQSSQDHLVKRMCEWFWLNWPTLPWWFITFFFALSIRTIPFNEHTYTYNVYMVYIYQFYRITSSGPLNMLLRGLRTILHHILSMIDLILIENYACLCVSVCVCINDAYVCFFLLLFLLLLLLPTTLNMQNLAAKTRAISSISNFHANLFHFWYGIHLYCSKLISLSFEMVSNRIKLIENERFASEICT